MLNFLKLKRDYSPAILKEGKEIFQDKMVLSSKIISLTPESVRLNCRVRGKFDNTYECEIEIDRLESMTTDSDCNCTYQYDCQHLAGILFHLEAFLDKLVVAYSKEANLDQVEDIDAEEKENLQKTFKEAATKEVARKDKKHEKELIEEYLGASEVLGKSPFFLTETEVPQDKAELLVICVKSDEKKNSRNMCTEIQLALRLPFRSKPLHIPNVREFLDAIRYSETLYIGNKRYFFKLSSFDEESGVILKLILDFARHLESQEDANLRLAQLSMEAVGVLFATAHEIAVKNEKGGINHFNMPCLYCGSLEEPLKFSNFEAVLRIELEYL